MKTRAEAHDALDAWLDGDYVGSLTYFRAPHSDMCDCVLDRVVKTREMDVPTRAAFTNFLSRFPEAARGEFWRNANGEPDRVKLVAPFDDNG